MNLQQLQYIVEVERYGSMNQAAKNLPISQPWLSTSIKELEKELNFRIFDRTSKGVSLTIEGKELIQNVRPLLEQINRIQSFYEQENNQPTLSISSGKYSFITKLCIDFYQQYFNESASFTLYTDESNCQTVVSNIFEQKFDLGVIHVSDKNDGTWKKRLKEKGIEFHFLFHSYSCIILRKKHPLLALKQVTMKDLLNYPLFHTNGRCTRLAHFDETPNLIPYDQFKRNVYTNNRNSVFDFISRSDAIFIGNSNFAIEELHSGLTTIPYPDSTITWSFYWIKRYEKKLGQNAHKFLSLLKSYHPNNEK